MRGTEVSVAGTLRMGGKGCGWLGRQITQSFLGGCDQDSCLSPARWEVIRWLQALWTIFFPSLLSHPDLREYILCTLVICLPNSHLFLFFWERVPCIFLGNLPFLLPRPWPGWDCSSCPSSRAAPYGPKINTHTPFDTGIDLMMLTKHHPQKRRERRRWLWTSSLWGSVFHGNNQEKLSFFSWKVWHEIHYYISYYVWGGACNCCGPSGGT